MDRVVRLAVTDPEWGRKHLPRLLDVLFADESATRLDAAWALCRLVDARPSSLPAVRRGLEDRLEARGVDAAPTEAAADGHPPAAALLVARYLDVRRRRAAATDVVDDPTPDGVPARDVVGRPAGDESGGPNVLDRGGDGAEREGATDDEEGATDEEATDGPAIDPPGRVRWATEDEALDAAVAASRFDGVVRRGPGIDTGYGREFLLVVEAGGDERTVAMTLLDRPTDDPAFLDALVDRMAAWRRVDDHEGVATVVDWGRRPHPWVATEYVTETLASRDRPTDPAAALRDARAIAAAVAHAHDRDVVHGGLDPATVVYRDDALDGSAPPRVTDVGLSRAFRRHVPPSRYLDRRFAAPEYFDRDYGAVDAATDVYHLGALCYLLVTGRPPYDGDAEAVRAGVLEGSPTPPSEAVSDVPPAVDAVVERALAARKLVRYDSVRELLGDLEAISV